MATSITQAKPLLTAAELELFDRSRAEPVKTLTLKQLASKEKRTRTLRDKYRDLYRRQAAAQKGKTGAAKGGAGAKGSSGSNAAGEANARTQRKADIMQEMLDRFESRSAQLESRAQKDTELKPTKGESKRATGAGAGKPNVSTKKAAPVKTSEVGKAKPDAKAPTLAKPTAQAKPVKAATVSSNGSAKGISKRKPGKTEAPLSAVNDLQGHANGAVHVEHLTGEDPTERSDKAPSDKAPTHGGKAQAPEMHAPIDMVPSAQRANPVRSRPGNIAIQGHVSSSIRRAQGKKDSR